jgi:hypothetical protein
MAHRDNMATPFLMSAAGGKPEDICSLRDLPGLTDGVDKVADDLGEAS